MKGICKFFLTAVPLFFCSFAAAGVSDDDTRLPAKVVEIMDDKENYIFGISYGDDPEETYQAALNDMVRKISVRVNGFTTTEMGNMIDKDGNVISSELFRSVIESYTTPASLEGVEVLEIEPGNGRFVYMPRENIAKMYRRRSNNIADLARSGIRARDKGKVDDALRHLYRAYVLLQSLPDPSEVVETVDGEERKLVNWIPDAMRDIINKVSFGIASVKPDEIDPEKGGSLVELTVNYDGRPATTCTFKYGTRAGYSPLVTARDGMALIELAPGVPMNPLKLYVEYIFKNENHANAELKPMLDNYKGAGLVDNKILLNENKKELKADKKETRTFQSYVAAGANEGIKTLDKSESQPYSATIEKVIKALSTRNYAKIDTLFTPEGKKIFDRLVSYGRVKVLGNAARDTYEFYPFRDVVMCRSVPMSFSFENGRRQFTEDVTFTLNKDARIESMAFGLGSIARKDIFSKEGAAWTDYRKMTLVNFLENYRTAFALRELDYIESIFDDNAVIIVGHVSKRLEKVAGNDGLSLTTKEHVTYARKSKQQYLEQLRKCFRNQEYISVRFSDTDVERSGVGGETYAIQLKQDYISATYGDQGYLFLFVDFNDEDKPLIHVRTWQPERNPELTPNLPPYHPRAGIFSPASF